MFIGFIPLMKDPIIRIGDSQDDSKKEKLPILSYKDHEAVYNILTILSEDRLYTVFEEAKKELPYARVQAIVNNFVQKLPGGFARKLADELYKKDVLDIFATLHVSQEEFILLLAERENFVIVVNNYEKYFENDRESFDLYHAYCQRNNILSQSDFEKDPTDCYEDFKKKIQEIDDIQVYTYMELRKKGYSHKKLWT